jgi:putative FmdB family regulatory protein
MVMPVYEFECRRHGRYEEQRQMGDFRPLVCDTCGRYAHKIFSLFQFQEDRARMWRGKDGTRYSAAFGEELPDSRSGIRALARERGVELDAHDMPHVKRAIEVGRAKREGVELNSREILAHINEPKEEAPSLAETLRRSGKMQAVSERIAVGFENWRDRGALSEAAFAQKAAQAVAAGPSILNDGNPV